MDLTWLQSMIYGLISGVTDIFPVSAQAHKLLLVKVFGTKGSTVFMDFFIHLAILGALYFSSQTQLLKISRALALARVPKRRRRRPLDTRSLMDFRMLRTMAVPVVIGFLFFERADSLKDNLILLVVFLFINGMVLYLPQFFPSSNRDARTLSPVEGFLMGIGGGVSVIPGISAVGAATSIGSICGVDSTYCLNMVLIMNMAVMVGRLVFDIMALAETGIGGITFAVFARCLFAAVLAFSGAVLGIRLMRSLAAKHGYALFGLYCFGLALFIFILNLMT